MPEGFVAPAQGPTFNAKAISFEMCEPSGYDASKFNQVLNRAVWLAADILHRYGWTTAQLLSHADVSKQVPGETDHTDPIEFLRKYGMSWDNFKTLVQIQLDSMNGVPAKWQQDAVDALTKITLKNGQPLLSTPRPANDPVKWWEFATLLKKVLDDRG